MVMCSVCMRPQPSGSLQLAASPAEVEELRDRQALLAYSGV